MGTWRAASPRCLGLRYLSTAGSHPRRRWVNPVIVVWLALLACVPGTACADRQPDPPDIDPTPVPTAFAPAGPGSAPAASTEAQTCRAPTAPVLVQRGENGLLLLAANDPGFSSYERKSIELTSLQLRPGDYVIAVMGPRYRSPYFYLLVEEAGGGGEGGQALRVYCKDSTRLVATYRIRGFDVPDCEHAQELEDWAFAVRVERPGPDDLILVWLTAENEWTTVATGSRVEAFSLGLSRGRLRLSWVSAAGQLETRLLVSGGGQPVRPDSPAVDLLAGGIAAGERPVDLVDRSDSLYVLTRVRGAVVSADGEGGSVLYDFTGQGGSRAVWHDAFFSPDGRDLGFLSLVETGGGGAMRYSAVLYRLGSENQPRRLGEVDLSGPGELGASEVELPRIYVKPADNAMTVFGGCVVFNQDGKGHVRRLVVKQGLEDSAWHAEVLERATLPTAVDMTRVRVLGTTGIKERVLYDLAVEGAQESFNCELWR